MKSFLLFLIRKYRSTGGGRRWFGVDCNFEPTCSEYTYQAIEKYGVLSGSKRGASRIKSCSQRDSFCKCIDPLS
ncbi:membrane protein insertion efficiency factor YidD [Pseudomonadales bacterium]|nr:membrane protein insertion efficiency factor YidD [Pseudomonadales bacterium]MDA9064535.1 membrane protein insertion efficiency factor YidD [Pseudomonadales bacterium]MDA9297636.1 membrane protein insertion efficiency factor YidD [Pseudomonadales bacterium]MDA9315930.1 membrane protein insertion efficiency factor YidD [Pseudomonadales bacterium]MDB4149921.1 membrane protein insertion efficiency factor YidD [Pseudomonadales bacterium]